MTKSSGSGDYGRFDELAEELAERYRRGERPSLDEYVNRLPGMADEIREMFAALLEVEQVEEGARDDMRRPLAPALARQREIGDFRIVREVGRGGMGVVYEAEQISLGRRVALKVLPGHLVGDSKALERFRREAKAAARLHHTNIVPVFDVGHDRDVAFYAMQFIQGQGLDQVIGELQRQRCRDGRPVGEDHAASGRHERPFNASKSASEATPGARSRTLGQMAESLLTGRFLTGGLEPGAGVAGQTIESAATEQFDPNVTAGRTPAVTIGDQLTSKPAADILSSAVLPGGTHVSDVSSSSRRQPYFHSVAQIGRQAAQALAYAHARGVIHRDIKPSNLLLDTLGVVWITDFGLAKADDDGLTATGDLVGTLRYMAPERFRGVGDARADIYALGLTLYELLTLRPAYSSSDRLKLIEQVKTEEPARLRSLDRRIPRDLEIIILKAIEKEPASRYPTADALAEDLRRFLADEPIKARQVSTTERYWRWAKRNPVIAGLGGALVVLLVTIAVGSILVAARFATVADDARTSATAEHGARLAADHARKTAEQASASAQAEAYRAMLSEVRALRAGQQLGWRDEALDNLARLAVMPTSRRDLAELRSEAVASAGEFGVTEVARFAISGRSAFSLDFSPDSRTLITASGDGNLDLWDVTGRKHLSRYAGIAIRSDDQRQIRGGLARFLSDGNLAYLDSKNGVTFLGFSGASAARAPLLRGQAKAIKLSGDRQGRWLAVGWSDGRLDLHDDNLAGRARGFDWNAAGDFAFSPDGRRLALRRPSRPVELSSIAGQGPTFTLPFYGGMASTLVFSPDGATLAGVDDYALTIWDPASRREKLRLTGHKEAITAIAFSPDGSLLATCCGDSLTRIWDARDGRPLTALPGPSYMQMLTFSPDGTYLAASSDQGLVCLYELQGRREQRRLIGHRNGVHRLAFHPTLSRLASSSDDHAVILWDASSAHAVGRWNAAECWVTGLAFSPNGKLIATTRGGSAVPEDASIRLWDAASGVLWKRLPGNTTGVWTLAFDPTGHRIASGDTSGGVLLFDVDTGRILRREILDGSNVSSLVFLNEGRSLLVGQDSGAVSLWELDQAGAARRVILPDGCTRLIVDRRGERAIVGSAQGSLIGLALPELKVVHRLEKQHDGAIASLALSPDGLLLATAGTDRRVVLRDPLKFQSLLTFPRWTGLLKDVAFDGTGRWLAFAGTDSEIGLWDLKLLRDELAAVGLAWDQPAPPVARAEILSSQAERARPPIPVIRPGNIDSAEFEQAQGLLNSGTAAFDQGRFADAAIDLDQACQRFQAMRRRLPAEDYLAAAHGMSLVFLGGTSRELRRPGESLTRFREALAILELVNTPRSIDLYNTGCACSMISVLDEHISPADRESLRVRAVEYIRRAIASGSDYYQTLIRGDHDVDPLRGRADFRDLMADLVFPRHPIVLESPVIQLGP
jgi:eukaryotic-like serine/threonine-protein kinase